MHMEYCIILNANVVLYIWITTLCIKIKTIKLYLRENVLFFLNILPDLAVDTL